MGGRILKHVVFPGKNVPIKAWVADLTHAIEDEAMKQLQNLSSMPFIYSHVAVMPDVHWGNGTSVGTVIATKGAIIPAAVGVDIGCGMMAVKLNIRAIDLPDNLFGIRSAIEAAVPHGRTDNGGPNDRGSWVSHVSPKIGLAWSQGLMERYWALQDIHPQIEHDRVVNHLGTLGTGNHFIEICLDESDQVWVMLHSGSRGIGNKIGTFFIQKAKEDMKRWFINLPDANLAYLPEGSENFNNYMKAVGWAQDYARVNRELMMEATIKAIGTVIPEVFAIGETAVNCHHNYVARENHFGENIMVTRKGAVQARKGTLGIIPGSMGARSFIVSGKGMEQSFSSCSHGAGRKMSRTAAKKRFTLQDHAKATAGVECRKDVDVIDETPGAYKDIDEVMSSQSDLVDIVHTLKQVVCVKG